MRQRADLDLSYIGTPFDRQVRIECWNQKQLSSERVLVLGAGGLGSLTAVGLLRLGIKELHLVDYDVVDIHNLNRQILYCLKDVGQSKVDCAVKNAEFHNIGGTKIVGHNLDAVKEWVKIVELAKNSTVVFNCIDYGDKYDLAVAALCLKLKIPLILGGTYAVSMTVDYYAPEGNPCALCCCDFSAEELKIIDQIIPDKVIELNSLSFLPKNNNPIGQSSTVVCTICSELMLAHYLNSLFLYEGGKYPSSRLISYHNTFETIKFEVEINKECMFCNQNPEKNQLNPHISDNESQFNSIESEIPAKNQIENLTIKEIQQSN